MAPRTSRSQAPRTPRASRSLPSARGAFQAQLPAWSDRNLVATASNGLASLANGSITVGWEYDSDDPPTAAQHAAYSFLKKNDQAVADAIVTALAREAPAGFERSDGTVAQGNDGLRASLGPPAVFLLEREDDGLAHIGFLFPCDLKGARHLDVITHGARVVRVGTERLHQPRANTPPSDPHQLLALRRAESLARPRDLKALDALIGAAMLAGELGFAAEQAARYAELRRGSRWYPVLRADDPDPPHPTGRATTLTPSKLRHDLEQLRYLQRRNVLRADLEPVLPEIETVLERLRPLGEEADVPMDEDARRRIGHVYKRLVHVRPTPRVERALSSAWNPTLAEDDYRVREPNVVVIDDFLTTEAIESLRLFCLESTVWSTNRYRHGRLGAFFRDGFNCPLLIQIAEELQAALPRIIGARHPLRQLWAFKYASVQPCLPAHADFAAVNVNFWITPDEANLDPAGGGLLLYDVAAPRDWDFEAYNRGGSKIEELLTARGAVARHIPYRYNRAVVFDSDLFHTTPALAFQGSYENRRINVTLLFGDRHQHA